MSKPLYMKPFPAFAAIEFNSVPAGIFAADALLKKSPIAMIRSGTIGEGRYLILLAGTTASVEEAHVVHALALFNHPATALLGGHGSIRAQETCQNTAL